MMCGAHAPTRNPSAFGDENNTCFGDIMYAIDAFVGIRSSPFAYAVSIARSTSASDIPFARSDPSIISR